jgi:hypothetical protein
MSRKCENIYVCPSKTTQKHNNLFEKRYYYVNHIKLEKHRFFHKRKLEIGTKKESDDVRLSDETC